MNIRRALCGVRFFVGLEEGVAVIFQLRFAGSSTLTALNDARMGPLSKLNASSVGKDAAGPGSP